jgi:phage repressor protein C with HTH and peptisase S24 domain
MSDFERLKKSILWIISQGYAESQEEIAEKIGVNASYLSQVVTGNKPLSQKLIKNLCNTYEKVNSIWILEGLGSMIISATEEEKINEPVQGVPYYDIDIAASITESFNDVKELPEFYVDFKPFNDCSAYLPIWGDSMYPTYASGEIIAVKKLLNRDVIQWGEAHLVITNAESNNMKTVKLLFQHDEEDKIILRASNPNFKGDTVISKDSILSLYIIKGKITRKQL